MKKGWLQKFKDMEPKKRIRIIMLGHFLLYLLILLSVCLFCKYQRDQCELISYQEYQDLLQQGLVDTVTYNEHEKYMYISLHNEQTLDMTLAEREKYKTSAEDRRKVYYPGGDDFKRDLLEHGVLVSQNKMGLWKIIEWIFGLIFVVFWTALGFKLIKRLKPVNESAVMETRADDIDIGFEDIIGHEEVKEDLRLLVKQMKSGDENFRKLTHGILFEGEPGTGKTMLAKAVAKEAGYSFISVNSSSFIELYVGVGAKRVRDFFDKARKKAPCIVFFDEIDSIGKKRGSRGSNSEDDQTINALLAEMDGFGNRGDIIVIAATNRASDLDPALVRAGRFDRKICIEVPVKWETRKELFDHYLVKNQLDESVNTESLAKQTVGYSGADIAAVCREANMIMFSKDKKVLSQEELEEAIDKILFKGNRSLNECQDNMEIVAYHEGGHAVMTLLCRKPVARISIMGMTSGVGGAVFQADEGRVFHTKTDMEQQIRILYAGRVSEEIKFGRDNVTDGAENDITEATKFIANYVMKCGFDNELIDYSIMGEEFIGSAGVAKRMADMSKKYYEDALDLLKEHYDSVEILAKKLLEVKTISGQEVEAMQLV